MTYHALTMVRGGARHWSKRFKTNRGASIQELLLKCGQVQKRCLLKSLCTIRALSALAILHHGQQQDPDRFRLVSVPFLSFTLR